MLYKFNVNSKTRANMIDITAQVLNTVRQSGVESGICTVFIPHTTAGIAINENADPDVIRDIKYEFDKIVPFEDGYHHCEGNSDAHIKSMLTGSSETVIIENSKLLLGTWQGIYLCEYDGPRERTVYVKIIKG